MLLPSQDTESHESRCYGVGGETERVLSISFILEQESSMPVTDTLSRSAVALEEDSNIKGLTYRSDHGC